MVQGVGEVADCRKGSFFAGGGGYQSINSSDQMIRRLERCLHLALRRRGARLAAVVGLLLSLLSLLSWLGRGLLVVCHGVVVCVCVSGRCTE